MWTWGYFNFCFKIIYIWLIEYPNIVEFPEQINKIHSFKGFYLFLSVTENFYYTLIEQFLNYLKIKEKKGKDLDNIEINNLNINSTVQLNLKKTSQKLKTFQLVKII